MAKYVELRRHTDADGDVLTPEGVRAAVEIGSHLAGGYDVLVSTGAQRATQTVACFLAGLGEKVLRGVVVEPGLRSAAEERWRAAYEKAGSGTLQVLREADPELVAEDSATLAPRCVASSSHFPTAVVRSSPGTAPRMSPPSSASPGRSSSPSRRAAACSSSRRTEPSESRSSADTPDGARRASLSEGASKSKEEDEALMTLQAGDKIVVESERVAQPSRAGVIEEVLQEDPPRVRVRWEDGHTSILTPSAGAARVIHGKTRAKA